MRRLAITGFLVLVHATFASAAPIGPDCCFNTIWDLTATAVNPEQDVYHIDFTATGTADTQSTYEFIDAVAFKIVANDGAIATVSLLSSPGGTWHDAVGGPIGGPGACTGGASGFICAEATDDGAAAPGDGVTLLWQFLVDLNGVTMVDGQDASIQASMSYLFRGRGGPRVAQQVFAGELSEGTTLTVNQVPEPALLLLLGGGLLAAAPRIRRNQAQP